MRNSEIRLKKLILRLRDKRFANLKAPCTAIRQEPLRSVLALRGCSATDLLFYLIVRRRIQLEIVQHIYVTSSLLQFFILSHCVDKIFISERKSSVRNSRRNFLTNLGSCFNVSSHPTTFCYQTRKGLTDQSYHSSRYPWQDLFSLLL